MDMKIYLKQATPGERGLLAAEVGSSVGYFYLIAGGHRKPSSKLCKLLVKAEPRLTLHELRPDIWSPPGPPLRRADDPAPPPGHRGRQPASPSNILDSLPERGVIDPTKK